MHGAEGKYSCHILIVAVGLSAENVPAIPGIELAESYGSVSVEPMDFVNKRVLIVGKGNSAFETADNLIETAALIHLASPNPLKMAWSSHYVGHLRAVNNNLLDTYQLKSQNAIIDAALVSIGRCGNGFNATFSYAHAQNEVETIYYDRVITCTGFRFDDSIFDVSCRPDSCIDGRFPKQTAAWESTNVPDVFFAGTLMQMRDFKRQMSGFIHGFRYNIRTLHRLIEERYHGVRYPSKTLPFNSHALRDAVLASVNRSSSIWQQPGFLCDAILLNRGADNAIYLEDLSLDYVADRFGSEEYLTVTLEYGTRKFANPFEVARVARDNTNQARDSNFLHPVVRHFRDGMLVSSHHVIEDLAAEWQEPEHIIPLGLYLDEEVLKRHPMPRGCGIELDMGAMPCK